MSERIELPDALRAEVEGAAVYVREIIDSDQRIADELHSQSSVGVVLANWGKVVASSIFSAGGHHEMNLRALAWIEYLDEFTR